MAKSGKDRRPALTGKIVDGLEAVARDYQPKDDRPPTADELAALEYIRELVAWYGDGS